MTDIPQGGQVVAIVMIAFFIGQVVKSTPLDKKWIPAICGFVGGILGIIGMYVIPNFPGNNWIEALAIGISSGLTATGVHQLYKQLLGDSEIQNGEEK